MYVNPNGVVSLVPRQGATPLEISAKVIEQVLVQTHQKAMQPKRENQPTFFDLAVQQRGSVNRVLETIAREVDFSPAEERVAATYGQGGRPACRVGVLLRVMILQHLYGLSDPQAEEQLKDRLSFQKFVQLDAHEAVPDETTICRFRQRLIECHLHEELLGLLNAQLEARGYIVKRVTLVDATLVESSRKRPEAQAAREGCAPDAEASYTRKYNQSFYGYKAHVSSDGEHQLIRAALISTASQYDGEVFTHIAPADSAVIYADKAYDTKTNQAWLRARGIRNGILKKEAHHIQLTAEDREHNQQKGLVRRQIERIFAHLKKWQYYRRVRYLGLARNQLELTLKAVAYNLKRLAGILKMQKA
jgi:IS5 family transposase